MAKKKTSQLKVNGELTIANALVMKKEILDALTASDNVVIDLRSVNEIDTAGLQLLILARRESLWQGKQLTFSSSSEVVDFVDLSGLTEYLGIAAA